MARLPRLAIKILGRDKMERHQLTFYTIVGLVAALYCMAAMIGSNAQQTRWALMFVISTIIFYEMAVNRKLDMQEKDIRPGGCVPCWVRHLTLFMTIIARGRRYMPQPFPILSRRGWMPACLARAWN